MNVWNSLRVYGVHRFYGGDGTERKKAKECRKQRYLNKIKGIDYKPKE